MNSEENKAALIPADNRSLTTRSPALISRGLRDLTSSLDPILLRWSKELRIQDSVEEAIGEMFQQGNEIFQCETYSLFVMDVEKNELCWAAPFGNYFGVGLEPIRIKIGHDVAEVGYTEKQVKRSGGGVVGWVARTGQLAVVPDTSKDSRFVRDVDAKGTAAARSIVVAPVCMNGRCLGVIELINCLGPEGFSRRSLVLLEALSDFAAVAIENSNYLSTTWELTGRDKSSGLYNRACYAKNLGAEIRRSQRTGSEFSLVSMNIDLHPSETGQSPWKDFRQVPVGVWLTCLEQLGQMLKSSCPNLTDTAYRCWDTRFALLIPGLAESAGETKKRAISVALDLSRQFGKSEWLRYKGKAFKLPTLVSVVSFPKDAATVVDLERISEDTMTLVRNSGHAGVAVANEGILHMEDES